MSLTTSESRQVEQLLNQDGHILAMTAVRLYQSTQREYTYFLTGVIALHRSFRGSFSFKIVDLKANRAVWEFPIVGDIKYLEDKPFFHSFVGQNCMMGLSFADDDEAKLFSDWYKSRENFVAPAPLAARTESYQQNSKSNSSVGSKDTAPVVKETPVVMASAPLSTSKKESSSGGGLFGFGRKNSDKAKPKFDKTMISAPSNFEHVSHVGFSATSGFSVDNIPMEWKIIFQKAGITDEQLQDKKQRKVVKQFMKENASLVTPPAIQPQTGQASPGMSRRAPPPPPSKRAPPPAPTRGSVSARQETYQQAQEPVKVQKAAPNPPARRLSNAPQPSYAAAPQIPTRGPPERPAPSIPDRGPPPVERYAPPVPTTRPPVVPAGGPPRILCPNLAPPPMIPASAPPPPTAPRVQQQAAPPKGKPADLLSQIQQGTKLRAVQQVEEDSTTSPKTGDDLADALKAALGNRLLAVAGSDSDDDSDDSEW